MLGDAKRSLVDTLRARLGTRQAERELRSRELENALRNRTDEVERLTKQVCVLVLCELGHRPHPSPAHKFAPYGREGDERVARQG